MAEISRAEVLAILGVVFGGAALLLAVFILVFLVRFRTRRFESVSMYDAAGYAGAVPELVGAKTAYAHVELNRPPVTAWRPFWPAFCAIIIFTGTMIAVPLLIWITSINVHVRHHNGTHSWK